MEITEKNVKNKNGTMPAVADPAPELKRKKRKKSKCYAVRDMELLYRLSDAGLLDKLHGITCTGEEKAYFFDRIPDVREIIEKFSCENGK